MNSKTDKIERRETAIRWIVFAVVAFLAASFIWPTPYILTRQNNGTVTRVNRFTGVVDVSTGAGWMTSEQRRKLDDESARRQAALTAAVEKEEATKRANLSKPRLFADTHFGSELQYNAHLSSVYESDTVRLKLLVSPFSKGMRAFYDQGIGPIFNLNLYDKAEFLIHKEQIEKANCTLLSDGKGGYVGIQFEGQYPSSEDEYKSLTGFAVTWYFRD